MDMERIKQHKKIVKEINEQFKKHGLHYEMKVVEDSCYDYLYKIYRIPFQDGAEAVASHFRPLSALKYLIINSANQVESEKLIRVHQDVT